MPTAATSREVAIVTKDELLELADWERKYADAKKKQSTAEKEIKFRRQQLAEKVLGIRSEDEFKKLSPAQVEKLQEKRLAAGDWKPEKSAPKFQFVKTNEGSYPAWRAIFESEFGQSEAARIAAETPKSYSYCVEVSL